MIAAYLERRRLRSEARRLGRAAVSIALATFTSSSNEQAHAHLSHVVWSDEARLIVQICFGTTRPPRRAWFSVTRDNLSVTPMTFEQVNAVYRVPVWR